ncbi:MAG: sigma 54 modulation/S30EA ribosomal C-terminal domain-containing protein, partial [Phycicoccus sp.]
AQATARIAVPEAPPAVAEEPSEGPFDGSPVDVREKVHHSRPMTLADALREMELVGHDFYLFHDVDTERASVVYRRQGWSYGVIHLDLDAGVGADAAAS